MALDTTSNWFQEMNNRARILTFSYFWTDFNDPTLIVLPGHFGATGGFGSLYPEAAAATAASFLKINEEKMH